MPDPGDSTATLTPRERYGYSGLVLAGSRPPICGFWGEVANMGGSLRRLRFGLLVAVALVVLGVPAAAAAPVFEDGDLIVGTTTGLQWLQADGSHVATLEDAFSVPHPVSPTALDWKAEFDPSGRLWVTTGECCGQNSVMAYDTSGSLTGPIVDPFNPEEDCGEPTDISFDAKGNAIIGDWGSCDGHPGYGAKLFTSAGDFVKIAVDRESDGVDLASDQCTLYYQDANGEIIFRKNICVESSPIETVFSPCEGFESKGMRILPGGSIISVEQALPYVVRVGSEAGLCKAALQTYDAPDCDRWSGLALNEDGTSFWSTCFVGWTPMNPGTPVPHEFDVASGAVVRTLATQGIVRAIFGGFRAAQDRTDPTVSLVTPTQGATYTLGQSVAADYACADLGGSDLASCVGNVADGAPIDTSSVGAKTFTVTATDGAGNSTSASATYKVVYNFSGFFHPVDNPPTFNVMPAGKAVKLMFKLGGNRGLNVIEPGYPAVSAIACGAPQDQIEKTVNASQSKLTYEARPQQYVYFWATNRAWRGSCRELVMKLNDGTEHRAFFRFT